MLAPLDELKVVALKALIKAFTGAEPIVTTGRDDFGEYKTVSISETQAKGLRSELEKQMKKAPGRVRVNVDAIFKPIIIKKAGPYFAGTALGAFMLGRLTKK